MGEKTIYIFELYNRQKDYAICLDFIKKIEGGIQNKAELLRDAEQIEIYVGHVDKMPSPRYLEEPILISDSGYGEKYKKEIIFKKHKFGLQDADKIRTQQGKFLYHIRIHFQKSKYTETMDLGKIIQLQYLAMLLKRIENMFLIRKNVTIFMVPLSGEKYPFRDSNRSVDYTVYMHISQYLRLLSKHYTGVIYGVDKDGDKPVVTSLIFRQNKHYKNYFPLIRIDAEKYDILFREYITDFLDELFSMKWNGRFRDSRNENPEKAMRDFIAETDFKKIQSAIGEKGSGLNTKLHIVKRVIKENKEISLMQFSLFSFMLHCESITSNLQFECMCKNLITLSHELCVGLKQIVQNAIQHTISKECFLSFYLHKKEIGEETNQFYRRISDSYPDTIFSSSEEALEVFVSDLNEKEDMVDSFVSNLSFELEDMKSESGNIRLLGHNKLIQNRDSLAIRNFFSDYSQDDDKESWVLFRQQDLIAHIGLSQFAQAARRCSASVRAISCKEAVLRDEKRYFYKAYSNKHSANQVAAYKTSVIPGSQFSVLIPVCEWKANNSLGIGQLQQKNGIVENYKGFATFLEYEEQRKDITINESVSINYKQILDAKAKYKLVGKWRRYWENKFIEDIEWIKNQYEKENSYKYVMNHSFQKIQAIPYLNDSDRMEVFLKGLIGAFDVVRNFKVDFFVALTNLPTGFIDLFRKISGLLSVKIFPENLQLCFQEDERDDEVEKRAILIGNDFAQVICNAYILSLEQGIKGFDRHDWKQADELKKVLLPESKKSIQAQEKSINVFPFDLILSSSKTDKRSFFERQLKKMSEGSLDEDLIGYKINNTHMRLGSKVHIESFYEMSFLFYRTMIANRLAFYILRKIINRLLDQNDEKEKIDILNDTIIFYGYASYSKAILTSITEMLREYRNIKCHNKEQGNKVAFASFQHNLMLESEETQMYFGLPSEYFPGETNNNNYLILEGETKIVQIVPISSTLTTFEKMWKKFYSSIDQNSKKNAVLSGNYTVLWVVDDAGDTENGLPSNIEKKYWSSTKDFKIQTEFSILKKAGDAEVGYFIQSKAVWNDPLECKLCYPEYLINEIPLVETDPTSTVPTLQMRYGKNMNNKEELEELYEERFLALNGCVLYDHICRRKNHYQFYIDTQRYFYNVKENVKNWLEEISDNNINETSEPVLHIIFSPEHNTNVGFAQYVNTYYFNGLAEIVSINVEKQFRSNFVCEHAALKRMIEELHQEEYDYFPVKFYFVDDTIVSGETIERANGLLHSLIPEGVYPVNLFSKIFVLLDRLSDQTKQMYVKDFQDNFLSFLHIDISHIRTRGDSCIGCKLELDAEKMLKRSATKNMASHWAKKKIDYRKKDYDDRKKTAKIDREKSYQMLVFTHVMQNILIKQKRCYQIGDAYDVMLNISLWLIDKGGVRNTYGYQKLLAGIRGLKGIKRLLKTICRPFFTYDFKIKRQAFAFFIFLSELLIGEKLESIIPVNLSEDEQGGFLYKNLRIKRTIELAEAILSRLEKEGEKPHLFLQNYILEGLSDMGSTYAMRKQTITKMYYYIENTNCCFDEKSNFWNRYAININRLVFNNKDETRELWLEYLYITGHEYREFVEKNTLKTFQPRFLFETVTGSSICNPQNKYFYQFCHNLFLQNTGINFDVLEERMIGKSVTQPKDENFLRECWYQMRYLIQFQNPKKVSKNEIDFRTSQEEELFNLFRNDLKDISDKSVNMWYKDFLNQIVNVINEKYDIDKSEINIAMLTESMDDKKVSDRIQLLDIVKEKINSQKKALSETRYSIKERISNAQGNNDLFDLLNNGYMISECEEELRPYVIAFFDNPEIKSNNENVMNITNIAKVFLYISIDRKESKIQTEFILRMILRDVMMYRNKILRQLKKDFAGDIYARYARKTGEKNILSHEKASSHNTTGDDAVSLEIFKNEDFFDKNYKVLKKEESAFWLLLRNYTNGQIAKIFNRSFHDSEEDENDENDIKNMQNSPMLYIPQNSINSMDINFNHRLDVFSKLNLKGIDSVNRDSRFELLGQIVDIRYDDSLENAEFIQNQEGDYYNLEYFKCIIIDILISAIKFKSYMPDYLLRVDRFLDLKNKLEKEVKDWNQDDSDIVDLIHNMKQEQCYVNIFRKRSQLDGIDYLIIRNPVYKSAHRLNNWEKQNEVIKHRLRDPLDYADGHMSLLAIKRYVEHLDESYKLQCEFEYDIANPKYKENEKLYFETRLPVLKRVIKESRNEKNNLD